jgi:hypothetical protein
MGTAEHSPTPRYTFIGMYAYENILCKVHGARRDRERHHRNAVFVDFCFGYDHKNCTLDEINLPGLGKTTFDLKVA